MTKKLEDLLNLPESQNIVSDQKNKEEQEKSLETQKETLRDIAEFDKITAALPMVKDLGIMADQELDEVAKKAMSAYDDLMDLGMNVESRYSSRVFEVAGNMLKTSLDAKAAKIDKKLKMIDLQIRKQKMDRDGGIDDSNMVQGEGYVITDRNSLIEKLKNMDK
jgi:hypothetical protein